MVEIRYIQQIGLHEFGGIWDEVLKVLVYGRDCEHCVFSNIGMAVFLRIVITGSSGAVVETGAYHQAIPNRCELRVPKVQEAQLRAIYIETSTSCPG